MDITRRSFLCAGITLPLFLVSCARKTETAEEIQTSFFCFDTVCAIGGVMERELLEAAEERCHEFEELFSRTLPDSDVGRINAANGERVEVDPRTADLIEKALTYCAASDGLFDITIGAVSSLWDFHEGVVPKPDQIADALPHVGYECVRVSGTTVQLDDPAARIDLGGIAKGYVSDVILDELAARGVQSAYVNLGGNVKVLGSKPDGSPWRVGIRDPRLDADEGQSVARVKLEDGSVVTSGLYERQFELDGRRYWHILDPRTGYPVQSDIASATIVSERSIDGDGYTKPLFMMDVDAALAWAAEHQDLKVLLINEAGEFYMRPEGSFELL